MNQYEKRVIFYKSIVLVLVSTVALLRALWLILSARSRSVETPARRFASGMMLVLFSLELFECMIWLVGVPMAATANGAAPWPPRDPKVVDRWCYSVGLGNYWLHYCVFFWQCVLAYSIWVWVSRRTTVEVLNRRMTSSLVGVLGVASLFAMVPVVEDNLGLWTNNVCFLRRTWNADGSPTVSLILHRMVMLPLCSFLILALNASTVYRLRRETQTGAVSSKRLQTRLVAVAVIFVTINMVQSVPFYLKTQAFHVDFAFRWLFAVGLLDVMVFTCEWPSCSWCQRLQFMCSRLRLCNIRPKPPAPVEYVSVWQTMTAFGAPSRASHTLRSAGHSEHQGLERQRPSSAAAEEAVEQVERGDDARPGRDESEISLVL